MLNYVFYSEEIRKRYKENYGFKMVFYDNCRRHFFSEQVRRMNVTEVQKLHLLLAPLAFSCQIFYAQYDPRGLFRCLLYQLSHLPLIDGLKEPSIIYYTIVNFFSGSSVILQRG